jgi:predicted permease
MDKFIQDVRYALRQLAKAPAFTFTAIITLALGIGANTAIYSLLDQVMLRSLPVKNPGELVMLSATGSDRGRISVYGGTANEFFSYPMYRDIRDKNSVLNGVLATDQVQVGVQWHDQPELVSGELVSGNYFDVLGVRPAMGRLMVQSDDEVQERTPVVVLSYGYWQRRFGSDPRVVNDTLSINGHPFTIIGVTQPGFKSVVLGSAPDVFTPMMMKAQVTPGWNDLENRRSRWLNMIGRLKPGMTHAQAEVSLAPLWHSLREDELKSIQNATPKFRHAFLEESKLSLLDAGRGFSPVRDQLGAPLMIVMGMVGLVVLIACANVASLLLVKAAGRVREMSIRYALGASRARVVQQLVVEGLVLGLSGGALGLLLAPEATNLLLHKLWTDSIGQIPFTSSPDARILLFNFAVSVIVGLAFSLAPALQFWRPNLTETLKQQVNTWTGGQLRMRRGSVAVQIGLSLLLLFGAGLFVRTLHNLKTVSVGFSTDHLVTFGLEPGLAGYDPKQMPDVFKRTLDVLSALPGVRAAGATSDPELSGNDSRRTIDVPGYTPSESERTNVEWSEISAGYFATLQIQLIAGRNFSDQDTATATKVVIVNESLAKHYFGDAQKALGRVLRNGVGKDLKEYQVVGVVKDNKHRNLRSEIEPTAFQPYPQNPELTAMVFYTRTWQMPETAMASIRTAMQNFDSKLVLDSMQTMDQQIENDVSTESLIAFLAVSFGILATFLAAIGLYGVLAFSTAQRTREIGIRMALGASRTSVIRMILQEVVWLAGISIAVALPTALLLARYLRPQLYGVSNADPVTLMAVVILVATVAMIAAMIPARRAAGVNPTKALRYE